MIVVFPSPILGDAPAIIEEMVRLLDRRRQLRVSRKGFLRKYAMLREALNATPEYAFLRRRVWARSAGVCEKCFKAPGIDMAHRKQVSFYPRLSLEQNNVYLACGSCHHADHVHIPLHAANE